MKKHQKLAIDYLSRTRELLATSHASHSDIAYLAGIQQSWVVDFSRRNEKQASTMDVSCIARLHDWLILTELAAADSQWDPEDALIVLGEAALYVYRHRQNPQLGGLLTQNERAPVLKRAAARIDEFRARNSVPGPCCLENF